MKRKTLKILGIPLAIAGIHGPLFLILAVLSPVALADQPYMGGYTDCSSSTTTRVLASHRFMNTSGGPIDAASIPSGRYIGGVVSIAGCTTTGTPSGYIYQNPVYIRNDNIVRWEPQTWYGNTLSQVISQPVNIGTGAYIRYYTRIDATTINGTNSIRYRIWAYDQSGYISNRVTRTSEYAHPSNDTRLKFGYTTKYSGGQPIQIRHYQYAVESNVAVTNFNWQVVNSNVCYYNTTIQGSANGSMSQGRYAVGARTKR